MLLLLVLLLLMTKMMMLEDKRTVAVLVAAHFSVLLLLLLVLDRDRILFGTKSCSHSLVFLHVMKALLLLLAAGDVDWFFEPI